MRLNFCGSLIRKYGFNKRNGKRKGRKISPGRGEPGNIVTDLGVKVIRACSRHGYCLVPLALCPPVSSPTTYEQQLPSLRIALVSLCFSAEGLMAVSQKLTEPMGRTVRKCLEVSGQPSTNQEWKSEDKQPSFITPHSTQQFLRRSPEGRRMVE